MCSKHYFILSTIFFILCMSLAIQIKVQTNEHKLFAPSNSEVILGTSSISARPNESRSESLSLNFPNENGEGNANSSLEALTRPNSTVNSSSSLLLGRTPTSSFSATKTTSTLTGGSGSIAVTTRSSSSRSSLSGNGNISNIRPIVDVNNLTNYNSSGNGNNDRISIIESSSIPTNEISNNSNVDTNIENSSNHSNENSNTTIDNRTSSDIRNENANVVTGNTANRNSIYTNNISNPPGDTSTGSDGRHRTGAAPYIANYSNNSSPSSINDNSVPNNPEINNTIDVCEEIEDEFNPNYTYHILETPSNTNDATYKQETIILALQNLRQSIFIPSQFSQYIFRRINPNWTKINIPVNSLYDFAAGPKGLIYIINNNFNLIVYDTWNNKCIKMNKKLYVRTITVAADGTPYVVDINNNLYYLNQKNIWSKLLDCVKEVTIGDKGEVLISNCSSYTIYQLYCISKTNELIVKNFHLNQLKNCNAINLNSKESSKVEVLPSGNPIILTMNGEILYYSNFKWNFLLGLLADDISISNKGLLYIAKEDNIYTVDYLSNPIKILKSAGRATKINTDENSLTYILDRNNKIFCTSNLKFN